MRLARGKYLTIYDAEDQPEPNQLKRAVLAFRRRGKKTACIQAQLNYYNADENWLTRLFTLEYSLWFDLFLPALERLGVPIPLGGTSNHFDLEKLREVGGWDPFNVTEDADLGLRFAAMGYDVGVIESVTYEEANSHVGNWIRQRSRWIKGYLQTWLVNMRHPWKLYRRVGLRGVASLQLFIAGTFVSGLAYPVIIPFLIWLFSFPMACPDLSSRDSFDRRGQSRLREWVRHSFVDSRGGEAKEILADSQCASDSGLLAPAKPGRL